MAGEKPDDSEERQRLLDRRYGTVVLDEAHKCKTDGISPGVKQYYR
jgi:hypothetical protein